MATIYIGLSEVENTENVTIISYPVSIIDEGNAVKTSKLCYSLTNKYSEYICNEVVDSAVVTLLSYALRGGYDIESALPITDQLYYTITRQLIPQLATCNNIYISDIKAKTISPDWKPYAVATAMSCGVDSLTTFFEYSQHDIPQNNRITHLTFFKNGAHHSGYIGHSEKEEEVYSAQLQKARQFSEKYNKELIVISSNVDEFLSEMFWEDSYDNTHSYRNAGFVLLLQKLIKIYYYSPAYNINEFKCSLNHDSALYERLIFPNVSSQYTSIYNSGGAMNRIEKIKYLSQFPETYTSLLVCYKGGKNCGECVKCKRTLVELDVAGVLELYKESFDLNKYRRHRRKLFVWCLSKRYNDDLMRQIHKYIKENHVQVPRGTYLLSYIRMAAAGSAKLFKSIIYKGKKGREKEQSGKCKN